MNFKKSDPNETNENNNHHGNTLDEEKAIAAENLHEWTETSKRLAELETEIGRAKMMLQRAQSEFLQANWQRAKDQLFEVEISRFNMHPLLTEARKRLDALKPDYPGPDTGVF